MARIFFFSVVCTSGLLCSCTIYTTRYNPEKKYSKNDLESDFILMRKVLEEKHPSLYMYTTKDSMDYFFDHYYKMIEDKMTERTFTSRILAPLISKIRCGHTNVGMSRRFYKWQENHRPPILPLHLRVWKDTMMVMYNLNTKDTSIRKGMIVQKINGIDSKDIFRDMFNCFSTDGYSENINYYRLSSSFSFYHYFLYGSNSVYSIECSDSSGRVMTFEKPAYKFSKKKIKKDTDSLVNQSRSAIKEKSASFQIDSTQRFALMTLNNFTKWNLRCFLYSSFRKLKEKNIPHLIIDLRKNGGGYVRSSTLLT
ncbi:MAG: hypothetical protein FGM46_01185, partial [Ferruginibacter sp.]|nr:hypothetical protein [Ferruginibacter sp.]